MPFLTFREAFAFGLALKIHCPGCHGSRRVELDAVQLGIGRYPGFSSQREFVLDAEMRKNISTALSERRSGPKR